MTYEELAKVNSVLNFTPIKGKDYAEVPARIDAFRQLYPDGSITTELLSNSDGVCVFKATVADGAGHILGTGHAYEKEGSTFINKTSYIENCETSAVGRALGMLGIGIKTSLASYEEVANAQLQQNNAPTGISYPPDAKTARDKIVYLAGQMGLTLKDVSETYGLNGRTSNERFAMVLTDMEAEYAGR